MISKEEYAGYTEQDKKTAASSLQRELICLKENQAFIQIKVKKFLDAGHQPSILTAVLCGRYEPFLPDIYRKEYPPVDQVVLEVAYRDSIVKHAREYRWDPDSEIAHYWNSRNKELGFPLYERGAALYVLFAQELESLELAENEFSVVVATHGCASVFKVRVSLVGESIVPVETVAELPAGQVPTAELPASADSSAV